MFEEVEDEEDAAKEFVSINALGCGFEWVGKGGILFLESVAQGLEYIVFSSL